MAARLTAYLVVVIVAATFIAGLMVGAQRDDSDGPVDLIIQNAVVYTSDPDEPRAEAVAVRGNQVLRVGSNREIARLQRPQTVMLDAKGGTVVPGFNDSHVELLRAGLSLRAADLTDSTSSSETIERISAWSEAEPEGGWVVGQGWPDAQLRNGVPSRQVLDAAVGNRPAILFDADRHSAWVSSRALQLAGITRKSPDPANGTIVRDPRTGEPTGVLHGAAVALVAALLPAPDADERAAAVRDAIAAANALGITSVQTVDDSPDALEIYDRLRRSGDLTLRIYSAIPVTTTLTESELARLDAVRRRFPDDPVLKAGALSIRLDGSVAEGAAALLEPRAAEQESPATSARTAFTPDDLNRTVRLADGAGWQVMTHATGDRAVRMALDAYAHAVRSNRLPDRGRRHRINGLALVNPADMKRFEPLGVLASMEPLAAFPDAPMLNLPARAPVAERAPEFFPLGRLAAETRVVLASGWPARTASPLAALHVATSGTAIDGVSTTPWPSKDRLKLEPAIDAYTSSAAWASFDEQRKGAISPGMLADLVVLSDDVFKAPSGRLPRVSVAVTIFDGKIVHSRTPRLETAPEPLLQH
jgi:predicted amidohydrolase YtcJ